jgi:hypothetical protein
MAHRATRREDDDTELEILGDEGGVLPQANDPFGNDEGDSAGRAGSGSRQLVNDPFGTEDSAAGSDGAARVVIPAANLSMEDDDNSCGVCMDEPMEGSRARLLCCRNRLCLNCAQRIGACPFCRVEPLMWGLH